MWVVKRPKWFEPVDSFGESVGLIGGIVVFCAVVAVVAWNGVRLSNGQTTLSELTCIDPTDPCNYSVYRVRNDTATPIVLRECVHHCGVGDQLLDPIKVAPGRVTPTGGQKVTALVDALDWWEVQATTGRLLGCLVLDGHRHKHDGDLVFASSTVSCRPDARATPIAAA